MCLDTVDKKPTVTEGEGWRVVKLSGGRLYPVFQDGRLRTGRWLTDSSQVTIHPPVCVRYKAAFHLFSEKDDAEALKIAVMASTYKPGGYQLRRVSYKDVVATGRQYVRGYPRKVIVAREIYIHPKGKK